MERRIMGAVQAMARSSPSTPMARVLRSCIVSRPPALILQASIPTATEVIRLADWSYQATLCMGRRFTEGVRARARCSRSTPMARDLGGCIISLVAATELLRLPHCFYLAIPYMGRLPKAAVGVMARYSPSTQMARALSFGIVSLTAMELIPMPDCFYRGTPCMGPLTKASFPLTARCSLSTPMARVLGLYIVSRKPLILI